MARQGWRCGQVGRCARRDRDRQGDDGGGEHRRGRRCRAGGAGGGRECAGGGADPAAARGRRGGGSGGAEAGGCAEGRACACARCGSAEACACRGEEPTPGPSRFGRGESRADPCVAARPAGRRGKGCRSGVRWPVRDPMAGSCGPMSRRRLVGLWRPRSRRWRVSAHPRPLPFREGRRRRPPLARRSPIFRTPRTSSAMSARSSPAG